MPEKNKINALFFFDFQLPRQVSSEEGAAFARRHNCIYQGENRVRAMTHISLVNAVVSCFGCRGKQSLLKIIGNHCSFSVALLNLLATEKAG